MLKRREALMVGAGAISAAMLAKSSAMAADAPAGGAGNAAFLSAVAGCINAGNICMDHCLTMFSAGNTSLAQCAESVNQMLAICQATGVIGASQSRYRAQMVQLCSAICTDCEKECRKHEKEHAICKACADACAAVVKAAVMIS